jgi:hypothetical protein
VLAIDTTSRIPRPLRRRRAGTAGVLVVLLVVAGLALGLRHRGPLPPLEAFLAGRCSLPAASLRLGGSYPVTQAETRDRIVYWLVPGGASWQAMAYDEDTGSYWCNTAHPGGADPTGTVAPGQADLARFAGPG